MKCNTEVVAALVKMYRLLAFFCCIYAISATPTKNIKRIIGGKSIDIIEHAFHVGLLQMNEDNSIEKYICGGSIISTKYALTAAHCVVHRDRNRLAVVSGTTFWFNASRIYNVVDIILHEKYDDTRATHDLAILKVSPEFELDGFYEKFIELANKDDEVKAGEPAFVTGWGTMDNNEMATNLQRVSVNIVGLKECKKNYARRGGLSVNNICAASPGKDACNGDSGGALVVMGVQVGIVSWGYHCGWPEYPGVYVDVAKYREWIDKHTKDGRIREDQLMVNGKTTNYTKYYVETAYDFIQPRINHLIN